MAMTQDHYGIRQYLREKGYGDNQITYNNGNVMLDGKYFQSATPETDGSTYDSRANLDRTLNSYKMQNNMDQVRGLLDQYKQKMSQAPQAFSYNPQSDPQYQSALRQAQEGAKTATNNAMVALGRRGIGNSSSAVTAANSIQQKAIGNVNDTILPQLMSQAYGRYMDQQNQQRQQAQYMLGLANTYNNLYQQQYVNQQSADQTAYNREQAAKQQHINLANDLSQRYGTLVTPTEDPSLSYAQVQNLTPLDVQKMNESKWQYDQELALKQQYQNATIANMNADNARQSDAAQLAKDRFNWEKDQASNKTTQPKSQNINTLYDTFSKAFTTVDPDTKQRYITDKAGLERAILSVPMSDQEYAQLYNLFGLEIPR